MEKRYVVARLIKDPHRKHGEEISYDIYPDAIAANTPENAVAKIVGDGYNPPGYYVAVPLYHGEECEWLNPPIIEVTSPTLRRSIFSDPEEALSS